MADDTNTPDTSAPPRPDLKAGQPLDLSTGKAPAKPPPKPVHLVPMPAPEGAPEVRAGRTVDFSTGKPGAPPRRKSAASSLGPGPVVRETIDLSTETARPAPAEAAAPAQAEAPGGKRMRKRSGGSKSTDSAGPRNGPPSGGSRGSDAGGRGGGPASSATSLADLLDPETLARLKGNG